MKKKKNFGKMIAISIVSLFIISGMSSVSACNVNSDLVAGRKHMDVGNVNILHSAYTDHFLYVTYTTEGG